MQQLIKEAQVILPKLGWETGRQITTRVKGESKAQAFHQASGYYLASPLNDVRDVWLGALDYKELQGIFIGATPKTLKFARKLIRDGFTYLPELPRSKEGTSYKDAGWSDQWLYKKLVDPAVVKELATFDEMSRQQCLRILFKNTLPFSLTAKD